ncbi:MAG: FG-GAP-like repeat-containing protein [Myxococcota bacterium]
MKAARLCWLFYAACGGANKSPAADMPDVRDMSDGRPTSDGGASPDAAPTLFHDVSAPCISDFSLGLSPPEVIGSGAGLLDADGDGDLDVVLASQSTPARFCRNLGGLAFEDATDEIGLGGILDARGFAAADYDADGDQDLYVTRRGSDRLYRNDGGHFVDVTSASGIGEAGLSYSAAFCDLDRDGDLDLYVGVYIGDYPPGGGSRNNQLLRNDGGFFVNIAASAGVDSMGETLAVTCVDYDDDGDLDLYEVNDFGPCSIPNRLWRNDGELQFTDVAPTLGIDAHVFGMSALACDIDNDLDLDLYASNLGANLLHRNDGGSFVEVAQEIGAAAMGYACASDPCRACTGRYGPYALCAEWAEFADRYADPTSSDYLMSSFGAVCFDADQDGRLDLAVVNAPVVSGSDLPDGWCPPNVLLHNAGGGFEDWSEGSGLAQLEGDQVSIAAGDLDGDGDLDLVVHGEAAAGPQNGTAHLLRNDMAVGHWLTVRPQGVASNRDGIGARVEVRAGDLHIVRELSGTMGFAAAMPHEAHFGLGGAGLADEVTVRWPSGALDRLLEVPADQRIVVVEGSSP